jgi:hypothetical protein
MKTAKIDWLLYVGIAWLFYDIFIKKTSQDDKRESEQNQEIAQSTQEATYPDSQYYDFADVLESAMENAGTDEESIYSVFRKIKNDKDFLYLKKAFGKRTYSGELFGGLTSLVDPTEDSLEQWLQKELSSEELTKVNKILSNNGVNYVI